MLGKSEKRVIIGRLAAIFIIVTLAISSFDYGSTNSRASTVNPRVLVLDMDTTFQVIEGFGFFGSRGVWWDSRPFAPTRELPLYAGGQPITDMEWIDFILLDMGITMWRNEIYPFLPVYSLNATNTQDSNWAEQRIFVKALNDRAIELGIDLRIILTVWSPPGEWKYNQHTRALGPHQSPPPPPDGVSMSQWNRLMPDHYVDFAYWLVSALEMYRDIGVEVYAISPQNEPFFNQPFNSAAYSANEFVEMLNIVVPIINEYFPNVYIFGAEAMLGHEHSSVVQDWANPAMHFHRRILEQASPEVMRNFVFAHHGYYDGVYAQALEGHPALWAAERNMLATRGINADPSHRLWMTETSGYSSYWLDASPDRPGSLALGMAIQSALIYGDVSAWVWWQGSATSASPVGGYYELMRPGLNQNKTAVSRHFYRYLRPGAVRINTELNIPSRYLMASAFVHDELDNTVVIFVNNGAEYYNVDIQGIVNGTVFQSLVTTGSPYYLVAGADIEVGSSTLTVPPHSIVTLVSGSYIEHGSPPQPAVSPFEMAERDVSLALRIIENTVLSHETGRIDATDTEGAIAEVQRMIVSPAFFAEWEVVNANIAEDGYESVFTFHVQVTSGESSGITEMLGLRMVYAVHYEEAVEIVPDYTDYVNEYVAEVYEAHETDYEDVYEAVPEQADASRSWILLLASGLGVAMGVVVAIVLPYRRQKGKQ